MNESELLHHTSCDACGSSDANAVYTDGHAFCFACNTYTHSTEEGERKPVTTNDKVPLTLEGEILALTKRGIREDTCRLWGYRTNVERRTQNAYYFDPETRGLVAAKIRNANKDFSFIGTPKEATLYGQWLWKAGGKKLVIVEGEIDALSVSQAQGNKWPVVSVPNGAAGAAKSIGKALDYVNSFEQVVIFFDMDDVGRKAAIECAKLLPPGKAFIADISNAKDANELLVAGRSDEIVTAIWNAKPYRPDGIVTLGELKARLLKPVEWGLPWWSESLTKLTYGRRFGELYAFGAGTGIGKTDWLTQQIVYDITELQQPVGLFFLEQQPEETGRRVAGKLAGRRFHVPDDGWTQEELVNSIDTLEASGKLYLYDSFGVSDWERIRETMRYLRHAHGVRIFYVDHLTALAAASGDERVALEQIMAEMGGLVKELDCILHIVSHLATPEGKPHEEGGRVMIRHFKGSRAIGFWCHFMFGLERDQHHEDPAQRSVTTFRVLKDRYTGQATGEVIYLGYEVDAGRLYETELPIATDGNPFTAEQSEF